MNDSQNPLICNMQVTGKLQINHPCGTHKKCLISDKNTGDQQLILKEISPEYSLEGHMLMLKL